MNGERARAIAGSALIVARSPRWGFDTHCAGDRCARSAARAHRMRPNCARGFRAVPSQLGQARPCPRFTSAKLSNLFASKARMCAERPEALRSSMFAIAIVLGWLVLLGSNCSYCSCPRVWCLDLV